jgi:large subunit ribosomal protein L29
MKYSEVTAKSSDELKSDLTKLKKELFNLRFQIVAGEQVNLGRFKQIRKDVARIKTFLSTQKKAG